MSDLPPISTAFLLAQVGAEAARRFAERVATIDLTPPQAGLLRLVAVRAGQSQQAVAAQLGMPPSRLVALVDGLERRGLLERRRDPADRRLSALHLTPDGEHLLGELAAAAMAHDDAVCGGLTADDRDKLNELLSALAEQLELRSGVHPGYRRLGGETAERC